MGSFDHSSANAAGLSRTGPGIAWLVAAFMMQPSRAHAASADTILETVTSAMRDVLQRLQPWMEAAYEREPALTLTLALGASLPVLALLGGIARGVMRPADATRSLRRRGDATASPGNSASELATAPAWPAVAWIEIEGGPRRRIEGEMIRIGRDPDNDVALHHETVHRFHAVIHRTEDAEFFVRDLSSREGNGVLVNGRRTGQSRLRDGDRLCLGEAVMIFKAQPA